MGYKRAFDLFADSLRKRISQERRKRLDEQHRAAQTEVTKAHATVRSTINSAVRLCVSIALTGTFRRVYSLLNPLMPCQFELIGLHL